MSWSSCKCDEGCSKCKNNGEEEYLSLAQSAVVNYYGGRKALNRCFCKSIVGVAAPKPGSNPGPLSNFFVDWRCHISIIR